MGKPKLTLKTEIISIDKIIDPKPELRLRGAEKDVVGALEKSMSFAGLLHPIVVYPEGDKYVRVTGLQRLEAIKKKGKKIIEAKVANRRLSEIEAMQLIMHEHIRKEPPVEAMTRFCSYLRNKDYSPKEIASLIMKDEKTVVRYISISLLPPDVQSLVSKGDLHRWQADAIAVAGWPNEKKMRRLAEAILKGELTDHDIENLPKISTQYPGETADGLINLLKRIPTVRWKPELEMMRDDYIDLEKIAKNSRRAREELVQEAIVGWLERKRQAGVV